MHIHERSNIIWELLTCICSARWNIALPMSTWVISASISSSQSAASAVTLADMITDISESHTCSNQENNLVLNTENSEIRHWHSCVPSPHFDKTLISILHLTIPWDPEEIPMPLGCYTHVIQRILNLNLLGYVFCLSWFRLRIAVLYSTVCSYNYNVSLVHNTIQLQYKERIYGFMICLDI